MARAFGPTPGRPYISGPPRPIHPPPRIPRDSGPVDVPDGPPRGPGEKLFGGQYTRAEVIQRYKRFGGPNEAIAAYKRRLDRQRKGIYLGQSSGTSSGQGSGSASGRGGTSVGSGPIVPVQRPPRFGGPKNGKPNLAIRKRPLSFGDNPDSGTPPDSRGFRDTVIRGPVPVDNFVPGGFGPSKGYGNTAARAKPLEGEGQPLMTGYPNRIPERIQRRMRHRRGRHYHRAS